MKFVRPLREEPPLLASFRNQGNSGANGKASKAKKIWDRFKKWEDGRAYKEVLNLLIKSQQGLCMYRESLVIDQTSGEPKNESYQVEHVLSQSGADGRVLDWRNLALSCWRKHPGGNTRKTCGDAKGGQDLPDGSDPRTLPLSPALLEVGSNGLLKVRDQPCVQAGVNPDALSSAIKILNLNSESLWKKCQDIREDLVKQFIDCTTLSPTEDYLKMRFSMDSKNLSQQSSAHTTRS
jgi:uncharacterized protein (TIGR02646 family)